MRNARRKFWLIAVGLTAAATAQSGETSATTDKEQSTRFARVAHNEHGRPRALQLAVVSYVPRDGADTFSVDLVSAIHIGDQAYYSELNERFLDYDAVLFEMIISECDCKESRVQDADRRSVLTNAQLTMRSLLGLAHQLEEVDYGQANFVHADLSSAELAQSMVDRGESLYDYFWRVFFASVYEYSRDPLGLKSWQFMSSLLTPGQDNSLKTAVAYDMTNVDLVDDAFGGPRGSAIIDARNERAIEVLRQVIDDGAQRIAIFYGVAHMPDFEERLTTGMSLVKHDTAWIDAWRLVPDAASAAQ